MLNLKKKRKEKGEEDSLIYEVGKLRKVARRVGVKDALSVVENIVAANTQRILSLIVVSNLRNCLSRCIL